MTKPAADYFKQFRSKAEIRADEEHDAHIAGECDWATCRLCIAESEAIARFVDEELDNDEQRCRNCGSSDFTRDGDVERCAVCGK